MLDIGMLVTGAVMVLVVAVASHWVPSPSLERGEALDRLIVPTVVGLLVARLAAAALDDRTSLRSVRALLVIRGGAELWAGAALLVSLLAWGLRRDRTDPAAGLADLAPFVLWGYGAYEVTCVVRDGCYGPASPVGLVPEGLRTRMFPLGMVVAGAVVALGFAVRHVPWPPVAKVLLAVGGVAGVRSIVSFWLPRLGDGLTRQHLESLAVLVAVLLVAGSWLAWSRVVRHVYDN